MGVDRKGDCDGESLLLLEAMTRETVIRRSVHVIPFTFFTLCHIQYIPSAPLFTASGIFQGLPLYD